MRFSTLSALLVTAALAVAPQTVAFASPSVTHSALVTPSQPVPAPPPTASDAERYAAREAMDTAIAKFEGGREVVVIGTTTLAIVLLLVIIVILL